MEDDDSVSLITRFRLKKTLSKLNNQFLIKKKILITVHLLRLALFPQLEVKSALSFPFSHQNVLCQSSPWFAFFVNLSVKRNRRSRVCRGAAGNLQGHWKKEASTYSNSKRSQRDTNGSGKPSEVTFPACCALGHEFHFLKL